MFVRPSFYDDFQCKAGKCSDSCCIGWEIDIDEFTLKKYKCADGQFGEKLRSAIDSDGEYSFFKLSENERCPFLNSDGLCDIYINMGEESLCDICTEHPRFYNQIGDITEAGLGLCCEKVCEMLFDTDYELRFVSQGDIGELNDAENFTLNLRNEMTDIIASPDNDLFEKMNSILEIAAAADKTENNIFFSSDNKLNEKVLSAFLETEPINDEWTRYIKKLYSFRNDLPVMNFDDEAYSKLLIYILYRHFTNAAFDGEFYAWTLFCCVSVYFVYLCDCFTFGVKGEYAFSDRIENVKRWSKQIEYSTENTDIIKDKILH